MKSPFAKVLTIPWSSASHELSARTFCVLELPYMKPLFNKGILAEVLRQWLRSVHQSLSLKLSRIQKRSSICFHLPEPPWGPWSTWNSQSGASSFNWPTLYSENDAWAILWKVQTYANCSEDSRGLVLEALVLETLQADAVQAMALKALLVEAVDFLGLWRVWRWRHAGRCYGVLWAPYTAHSCKPIAGEYTILPYGQEEGMLANTFSVVWVARKRCKTNWAARFPS